MAEHSQKAFTTSKLKKMEVSGAPASSRDRNSEALADDYGRRAARTSDCSSFAVGGAANQPSMGRPSRAKGGKVRDVNKVEDGGPITYPDEAMLRADGGRVGLAKGGRAKGKTVVNVIIGHEGQGGQPPPPPMAQAGPTPPPRPPMPPPGPPPGMPPPGGPPPGGMPPPGMPPGRFMGGRAGYQMGGMPAGGGGMGGAPGAPPAPPGGMPSMNPTPTMGAGMAPPPGGMPPGGMPPRPPVGGMGTPGMPMTGGAGMPPGGMPPRPPMPPAGGAPPATGGVPMRASGGRISEKYGAAGGLGRIEKSKREGGGRPILPG